MRSNSQDHDLKQQLAQGVSFHQNADFDNARRIYNDILKRNPAHAETLHWLGALEYLQGNIATGIAMLEQAIQFNLHSAVYHNKLGNMLAATRQFTKALAAYEEARKLEPENADIHFNIGQVHFQLNQFEQAKEHLQTSRVLNPRLLTATELLGDTFLKLGKHIEALSSYQQCVSLSQQHPDAFIKVALAYEKLGDGINAMATYQHLVKKYPAYAPAYVGAGKLFHLRGDEKLALQTLKHALRLDPENSNVCLHIAALLSKLQPHTFTLELDNDLKRCFAEPGIDHQQLANVTAAHLLLKYPATQRSITNDAMMRAFVETMSSDSLWLDFLANTINTNAEMELLLTAIRRVLLNKHNGNIDNNVNVICAMSLQVFANEYIFHTSQEEQALLDTFTLQTAKQNIALFTPVTLLQAMYQPINLPDIASACEHTIVAYPLLHQLLQKTVVDVTAEHALVPTIKTLAENEDAAQVVNTSPYPRWTMPPAPTATAITDIIQLLPGVDWKQFPQGKLSVLIAGCGSGFEPIEMARTDHSVFVTAVDRNKHNLAYARHMANRLAIPNIEFFHGDILQLERLGKQFELITSTGALQHMADPVAGWRTLCKITRPGGVMRISLNSSCTSRQINSAHQAIIAAGITGSVQDIKRFRKQLFAAEPGSALRELLNNADMYNVSSCRDFIFTLHEQRFTLLQISALIDELGLKLIDFDVPAATKAVFNTRFPDGQSQLDLTHWSTIEQEQPDICTGMYQFWCQKIAAL